VVPGSVYLPPDADVLAGDLLTIDGDVYQVRSSRIMPDPVNGSAGCVVAEVSREEP
jgi:hypothetical protein